jgi:hypothetical protein
VEVAAAVEWAHRCDRNRVVAILMLLKDFDLENKAIDQSATQDSVRRQFEPALAVFR